MTAAPDPADAPGPQPDPAPSTSAHPPSSNPTPAPATSTPGNPPSTPAANPPSTPVVSAAGNPPSTPVVSAAGNPPSTPATTAGNPPSTPVVSEGAADPGPTVVSVTPAEPSIPGSPIDILSGPSSLRHEPHSTRAAKRTRPLTIVMVVLLAATIAAGITVGPTIMRVTQQRNATLAMPETVADLKRDDSEGAKEAASDLVIALRAEIDLDHSAAAVYSDPTNDPGRSILLFGGTTLLLSPERELDAVLKLTEDAGDKINDLQSVDPGPLGGVMKCGSTGAEAAPMAVCGWADHGSIALALFPERSPADAAFLMRTLRSATLTR